MKTFTEDEIKQWHNMIGMKVSKTRKPNSEPKPFKSGLKVNTVKGIVQHNHTPNLAFVFDEDESQVECWRCNSVN